MAYDDLGFDFVQMLREALVPPDPGPYEARSEVDRLKKLVLSGARTPPNKGPK